MVFDDIELSSESTEVVANLKTALKELKSTLFELDKTIKILKSAQVKERGDVKLRDRKYIFRGKNKS